MKESETYIIEGMVAGLLLGVVGMVLWDDFALPILFALGMTIGVLIKKKK